jgi:hypothetical protein
MIRSIGIWVFGLLASAIVGGLAGLRVEHDPPYSIDWLWGILAGMFTFACVRLWIGGTPKN